MIRGSSTRMWAWAIAAAQVCGYLGGVASQQADVGQDVVLQTWVAQGSGWPASWRPDTNPCTTWEGVVCNFIISAANHSRAHVTEIWPHVASDFNPSEARGDISGWSQLTSATVIDLNGCSGVTGDISGWSQLTMATVIDLNGCSGVTGDISGWSQLTMASVIDLNGCSGVTGDISGWNAFFNPRSGNGSAYLRQSLDLLGTSACGNRFSPSLGCGTPPADDWCQVSVCCEESYYAPTLDECIFCPVPERCTASGCIYAPTLDECIDVGQRVVLQTWVAQGSGWPASWRPDTNPCTTWEGVVCNFIISAGNHTRAHVTEIRPHVASDFNPSEARGDISGWSQLTTATVIDLNGCSGVTGDISGWSQLTMATVIDLNGCSGVTGDISGWNAFFNPRSGNGSAYLRQSLDLLGTSACGNRFSPSLGCGTPPADDWCQVSVCCEESYYAPTLDECIFCPVPERCTASGCIEGYAGNGCVECDTRAEPPWASRFGACIECSTGNQGIVMILVAIGLSVIFVYVVSEPSEHATRLATSLASLLQHLQIFSFSVSFRVSPPAWFLRLWSTLGGMVFFSFTNIAPPECYQDSVREFWYGDPQGTRYYVGANGHFESNDEEMCTATAPPCTVRQNSEDERSHYFFNASLLTEGFGILAVLVLPVILLTVLLAATARCSKEREPGGTLPPSRVANARLVIFAATYSAMLAFLVDKLYACKPGRNGQRVLNSCPSNLWDRSSCECYSDRSLDTLLSNALDDSVPLLAWPGSFFFFVYVVPFAVFVGLPSKIYVGLRMAHKRGEHRIGHTWEAKYRTECYWMELVVFASKLVMSFIAGMMQESPWRQLLLASSVCAGRLVLHVAFLPLNDNRDPNKKDWTAPNKIEGVSLASGLATQAVLALSLATENKDGRGDALEITIGVLLLLCGFTPLAYMGKHWRIKDRGNRTPQQTNDSRHYQNPLDEKAVDADVDA